MKVLVIDRDYGAQRAYMASARSGGCTTFACDDNSDIIGLVNRHGIDALILGVLPEIGVESLRRLRLSGINLPVILISATRVDRDETRRLGAEAILSKPPDVAEFKVVLARLKESRVRDTDFAAIFRFLERCRAMEGAEAATKADFCSN